MLILISSTKSRLSLLSFCDPHRTSVVASFFPFRSYIVVRGAGGFNRLRVRNMTARHGLRPFVKNFSTIDDLPKSKSSLLTQIRTGKIGLAAFLHKRRVPGFELLLRVVGQQLRVAVGDCKVCDLRLSPLRQAATSATEDSVLLPRMTSRCQITISPQAATALTAWFLHLSILLHFSWALDQL